MMRQDQIQKKEEKKDEEDDDIDMNQFVKDLHNMNSRIQNCTSTVHEQDQRFVQINDKLDDYNKDVKKGERYVDIVNKGPLTYLKDKVFGWFKSSKEQKLSKKDKKIIEKARNTQIQDNKNNEYCSKQIDNFVVMTKDKEAYKEYNENKEKNDDDILDEALKEAKIMRGNVKEFGKAVENSNKLVDATNRNMDRSINNVNRVNKEMKKAY